MTKPIISHYHGLKTDWATMQKLLKFSTTSVSLTEKKVVSAHQYTGPHVQTCGRST